MKNHCWRCKHHRSWHQTGKDDQVECECRSHGCTCNAFWNMPKEIEQPNSRLRSVPHPYPDGPLPDPSLKDEPTKYDGSEKVSLGPSVYPDEPIFPLYGRGPADVFMDEMEKINPNARVALSAGHKMIDQVENKINPDAKSMKQRIAMKKDEDTLGPGHDWRELDEIATEARENITDTFSAPIKVDECKAQVQQIVRRAMHEARRPLLEQMSDRAFKDAHPPMIVSTEKAGPLNQAIQDLRKVHKLWIDGEGLHESLFMDALGKLGRVFASMSEQPTQREPEKPPEPLSKSEDSCPVCGKYTQLFQRDWRTGRDLYECSECHVLTSRSTSARRDISKAPGSGAGAVEGSEVSAR